MEHRSANPDICHSEKSQQILVLDSANYIEVIICLDRQL